MTTLQLVGNASQAAEESRWSQAYLPNATVLNQRGESLRFYDDVLKSKIAVISFIYTSCRDICPVVTARLLQLEDKLGAAVGRDIFFVSISIDPVTDTPEKLKEYADAFQAGPGQSFLTGRRQPALPASATGGSEARRADHHLQSGAGTCPGGLR